MSYDHSAGAESKQAFLCRLLDLNIDDLIYVAISNRMSRLDIEITEERYLKEPAECGYSEIPLSRIEFADGRVFEHRLTEHSTGDSWGCDSYEFVELGQPYEFHSIAHVWDHDGERKIKGTQTFIAEENTDETNR